MTAKQQDDRLARLALSIGHSLSESPVAETGTYEYTASFKNAERHELKGSWKVVSHLVDGVPYERVYAEHRFPDETPKELSYDSMYEFHTHHCVKRVLVTARLEKGMYEYRLTVVLSWRIREKKLTVQPLIGYQYISLDGKPAVIQELPPDPSPLAIKVEMDGETLVFTDNLDVKRLERISQ